MRLTSVTIVFLIAVSAFIIINPQNVHAATPIVQTANTTCTHSGTPLVTSIVCNLTFGSALTLGNYLIIGWTAYNQTKGACIAASTCTFQAAFTQPSPATDLTGNPGQIGNNLLGSDMQIVSLTGPNVNFLNSNGISFTFSLSNGGKIQLSEAVMYGWEINGVDSSSIPAPGANTLASGTGTALSVGPNTIGTSDTSYVWLGMFDSIPNNVGTTPAAGFSTLAEFNDNGGGGPGHDSIAIYSTSKGSTNVNVAATQSVSTTNWLGVAAGLGIIPATGVYTMNFVTNMTSRPVNLNVNMTLSWNRDLVSTGYEACFQSTTDGSITGCINNHQIASYALVSHTAPGLINYVACIILISTITANGGATCRGSLVNSSVISVTWTTGPAGGPINCQPGYCQTTSSTTQTRITTTFGTQTAICTTNTSPPPGPIPPIQLFTLPLGLVFLIMITVIVTAVGMRQFRKDSGGFRQPKTNRKNFHVPKAIWILVMSGFLVIGFSTVAADTTTITTTDSNNTILVCTFPTPPPPGPVPPVSLLSSPLGLIFLIIITVITTAVGLRLLQGRGGFRNPGIGPADFRMPKEGSANFRKADSNPSSFRRSKDGKASFREPKR